jgi:hypothetical protein
MSYTVIVKGGDGTISRERVRFPTCPPVNGKPAVERREEIFADLAAYRQALRHTNGWSKDRKTRFVASIPPEVYNHVMRNEGPEAVKDAKYMIRRSQQLGIDPRVSKGRF